MNNTENLVEVVNKIIIPRPVPFWQFLLTLSRTVRRTSRCSSPERSTCACSPDALGRRGRSSSGTPTLPGNHGKTSGHNMWLSGSKRPGKKARKIQSMNKPLKTYY